MDFSSIVAEADQLSTPYIPAAGSPASFSAAYTPIGLPENPNPTGIMPPGLEGTQGYKQPGPPISSVDSLWTKIKSNSLGAISTLEKTAQDLVTGAYDEVKSGVSTVASDIAAPVKNALTSTYMYLLLGVVVVGGVIYFAGKSGALRISKVGVV